jgi:hypothetical protein
MRTISKNEYDFLLRVQSESGKDFHVLGLSRQSVVEPMADGGMGSLRFTDKSTSSTTRSLGSVIVQGEFDDADGVPVSFTINQDTEGKLFELDLWRVDFEPLKKLPSKENEIRILPVTA